MSRLAPSQRYLLAVIASIAPLLLAATPASAASLIGDTIEIVNLFPTLSDTNVSGTVVVDSTDTDRVTFGGGSFAHANELQLIFTAPAATQFATGSPDPDGGNFILFRDLNFDDGSVITSVSLSSTFGLVIADDIEFGDDFVRFDVDSLTASAGDAIIVELRTSSMDPLPPGVATLTGDRIEILNLFPSLNNVGSGSLVIVDDTDTDRVTFGGGAFAQASDLQLIFSTPNGGSFATGSTDVDGGNFIVFQDLDFADGSMITGVSLSSTFGGIGVEDLAFGSDFVRFNLSQVSADPGDLLVIELTTDGTVSPVPLASAVLPASRSVQTGTTATAFATILNPSPNIGRDCAVSLASGTTGVDFFYQATDSQTNAPIGDANTPVEIAAGGAQSFVFGITPQTEFEATEVALEFSCTNSTPAPSIIGLNTLLLAASQTAVADVVALAATFPNDGIVRVDPANGAGAFSVASINLGATETLLATADTGDTALPVGLSLCQTDPTTGQCINPTVPTADPVSVDIGENETPTFSVFASSNEEIALDPANTRVFVRFQNASGETRGATSVAITRQ